MQTYTSLTKMEAQAELERLEGQYKYYQDLKLKLDMTRGKPCVAQLDMVSEMGLERAYSKEELFAADGTDCRNYGGLFGLPEARTLFAEIMAVPASQVLVANNASLNLIYDAFAHAFLFPLPGMQQAWGDPRRIKVLCPAPGYDRHFKIAESFGCELITVRMTEEGPDMDQVEELLRNDDAIKAMLVVPVYSNPDGYVFSENCLRRMAAMEAPQDFRIFFDNAYLIHNLVPGEPAPVHNILAFCEEAGHPDRVFEFASTSKMSFAGAGISAMATSEANLKWFSNQMQYQTIGPDKVRQLRHVNFFKENGGVAAVMARHAAIIAPKFAMVIQKLNENFSDSDLVTWHEAKGGYFISINLQLNQAKAVVAAAKEAGVALTPAGATFPYGKDPQDANIRIAPSFPELGELEQAMDILCLCIKICALRRLLA